MSINEGEGIQVECIDTCLVCGAKGLLFYTNVRDSVWGALGVWSFFRCLGCGLVWLNPRPIPEDVGKLYGNYLTHDTTGKSITKSASLRQYIRRAILAVAFGYDDVLNNRKQRWLGKVLSLMFPLKEVVGMEIMYLSAARRGRLLDVGCGNGQYLANMRDMGWEVFGVEPDPEAARVAKQHFGVSVAVGNLENANLLDNFFHAVTINHVIEHVRDPIGLLRECYRVLRPGGSLVVVTPNIKSMGHRIFGGAWRGFDTPRHFYLFNTKTLSTCTEHAGFQVGLLRTSGRMARTIWIDSWVVWRRGRLDPNKKVVAWPLRIAGLAYWGLEQVVRLIWKDAGEEILLVATKNIIEHKEE